MKSAIICDIDGTVADLTHRLHHIRDDAALAKFGVLDSSWKKNWPAFFGGVANDGVHEDVRQMLEALMAQPGMYIHYVSGRPEKTRSDTAAWLCKHGFPYGPLHMRADGDYRADDIVKEEILDTKLKLTPEQVLCVFDDRDRVVAMWRRRGFRVLQVAPGEF